MNNNHHRLVRCLCLACAVAGLFASPAQGQSPTIVIPPLSQAVTEGTTVALSVSVTGALPITYTWKRNFEFTNYYQATLFSTNCFLVLTNLTPDTACFFRLDVNNASGSAPGKQVVVAVISAGMETNGFALTIRGLTNTVWRVECSTNDGLSDWFTLTNVTINPMRMPFYRKFVDLAATNLSRFYRVTPKVD